MKKIELIELVKDYLAGGDAPTDVKGRYHDEIIHNHLNIAFNRVINSTYYECKQKGDFSVLSSWGKDYTVTITNLTGTNGDAVLPFPPMQIYKDKGVLQVLPSTDATNAFVYRTNTSNPVFAVLESEAISQKSTYYLEMADGASGVEYVLRLAKIPSGCTEVKIKMLVPFYELDDYDNMAIPEGKEQVLVMNVVEIIRGKPAEDTVNDNKAKQV